VTFEEMLVEGMRNIGDVLMASWETLSVIAP